MKLCEKLDHLPTNDPMYVSVTGASKHYHSEGYVIRFFKSDSSSWVANFQPGATDLNQYFEYPTIRRVIVIAGGSGYIMSTESTEPIITFGDYINEILQLEDNSFIGCGNCELIHFNETGIIWKSPRISWDDIKDLSIAGNIITGLSYDPLDSNIPWKPFTLNLENYNITGGSYRLYMDKNGYPVRRANYIKIIFWLILFATAITSFYYSDIFKSLFP